MLLDRLSLPSMRTVMLPDDVFLALLFFYKYMYLYM